MELFPPWFLNSRVRHAGLPRKAAVPPLGPVWPLPPIAGSEFSPSSGSTHFNKTNRNTIADSHADVRHEVTYATQRSDDVTGLAPTDQLVYG